VRGLSAIMLGNVILLILFSKSLERKAWVCVVKNFLPRLGKLRVSQRSLMLRGMFLLSICLGQRGKKA